MDSVDRGDMRQSFYLTGCYRRFTDYWFSRTKVDYSILREIHVFNKKKTLGIQRE